MRAVFAVSLTCFAALLGCGGSVAVGGDVDSGAGDSGTPSDTTPIADTGVDVPSDVSPICNFDDGLPKCDREGCKNPPFADCRGCIHFSAPTDASPFGVCIGVTPEKSWGNPSGPIGCAYCRGGQNFLCAKIDDGSEAFPIRCVAPSICRALDAVGLRADCYWQDKSPWDPAAAIPTAACPAGGAAAGFCGTSCGGCGKEEFCTGVSPTHPIGVCAAALRNSTSGMIFNRCRKSKGCDASTACLTFTVAAPGNQAVADEWGVCIENSRCKTLAAGLPGGATCTGPGGAAL